MFTNEELKNILVLVKAGAKSMELDGNGMVVVGVLVKKLEDMQKAEPVKEVKKEEPVATKTVKPTRGTALVN